MVSTARSSIRCCKLSISASAATTRLPSTTSRRTSASTDSTIIRSARPPISATSRVSSCRSLSNALAVCSLAIFFSLSMRQSGWLSSASALNRTPETAATLAKPACDVILSAPIARRSEYLAGVVEFDQFAEIHEGGLVGDAGRLLHVVGDDGDGVVLGQFLDQFLDLGGRNRIERRAW